MIGRRLLKVHAETYLVLYLATGSADSAQKGRHKRLSIR
jgi:hypothetical protein